MSCFLEVHPVHYFLTGCGVGLWVAHFTLPLDRLVSAALVGWLFRIGGLLLLAGGPFLVFDTQVGRVCRGFGSSGLTGSTWGSHVLQADFVHVRFLLGILG